MLLSFYASGQQSVTTHYLLEIFPSRLFLGKNYSISCPNYVCPLHTTILLVQHSWNRWIFEEFEEFWEVHTIESRMGYIYSFSIDSHPECQLHNGNIDKEHTPLLYPNKSGIDLK